MARATYFAHHAHTTPIPLSGQRRSGTSRSEVKRTKRLAGGAGASEASAKPGPATVSQRLTERSASATLVARSEAWVLVRRKEY